MSLLLENNHKVAKNVYKKRFEKTLFIIIKNDIKYKWLYKSGTFTHEYEEISKIKIILSGKKFSQCNIK